MTTPKLLTVYEPGLPNTPGWTALSEAKRTWLQEKTSNIKKYGAMEGLNAASGAIELYEVKTGLEGEKMGITDYIRTVFGQSERTGFRRLETVEEWISDGYRPSLIRKLAEKGALLLQGASGLGLNELRNATRELPPPKDDDDKTVEGFIEHKLRPAIAARRSDRRKGKAVRLKDEDSLKILFNTGRRIHRATKSLVTSADNREFLKTIVGWWMDEWAVSGKIDCVRIPVPDGVRAQVGYPKGKKRKKAA